jgi:hypothetical protein
MMMTCEERNEIKMMIDFLLASFLLLIFFSFLRIIIKETGFYGSSQSQVGTERALTYLVHALAGEPEQQMPTCLSSPHPRKYPHSSMEG